MIGPIIEPLISLLEVILVIGAILAIGALIATGSFRLLYRIVSRLAASLVKKQPCEVIPIRPEDPTSNLETTSPLFPDYARRLNASEAQEAPESHRP